MSKWEWERGEIVIPANQWTTFKAGVRQAYNRYQDERYEWAVKIYERLKDAKNPGADSTFYDLCKDAPDHVEPYVIRELLAYGRNEGAPDTRPKMPRKSQFPHATRQSTLFRGMLWTIRLIDRTRVFQWEVTDNNHSVERTHCEPMVISVFRLLDAIDWKRNSGGKIIGNDEGNCDTSYEGGGSNYVTHAYGPKGGEGVGVKRLRFPVSNFTFAGRGSW